jgi:hypothetical protein
MADRALHRTWQWRRMNLFILQDSSQKVVTGQMNDRNPYNYSSGDRLRRAVMEREVVLILMDVNPVAWTKSKGPKDLSFPEFLDQLFAYLTQMILSDVFQVAPMVAYSQKGAKWLYPTGNKVEPVIDGKLQATNADEVKVYFQEVLGALGDYASETVHSTEPSSSGVRLDAALSLALCHLNRYKPQTRKRILILSRSEDPVTNFESTMNAILAAHRLGVTIDSVLISVPSSLFLNQAAILTNGFSISLITRPRCLMMYLLSIPSLPIRDMVALKRIPVVDYKTPAVNTGKLIDTGLMCPICLSVYEQTDKPLSRCRVCGAREGCMVCE